MKETKSQYQKRTNKGAYSEIGKRISQINALRLRAEAKGIPFDITHKDVECPEECPILKVPLIRGEKNRKYSPSVDRMSANIGYLKGNVRIISRLANSMKSDASPEEIKTFCDNIFKYLT